MFSAALWLPDFDGGRNSMFTISFVPSNRQRISISCFLTELTGGGPNRASLQLSGLMQFMHNRPLRLHPIPSPSFVAENLRSRERLQVFLEHGGSCVASNQMRTLIRMIAYRFIVKQ